MAKTQNAKNFSAFNAEFDGLLRITPWPNTGPGGSSADFYAKASEDGETYMPGPGWMIRRVVFSGGPCAHYSATRVSESVLDQVAAVAFDPYNNIAAAKSYLAIADANV